jgi:hypothetical protein
MLWSLSAARVRHAVGAAKAPAVRRALDAAKTANMPSKGDGPRDKILDCNVPISGRPSLALAFFAFRTISSAAFAYPCSVCASTRGAPYEWPTN